MKTEDSQTHKTKDLDSARPNQDQSRTARSKREADSVIFWCDNTRITCKFLFNHSKFHEHTKDIVGKMPPSTRSHHYHLLCINVIHRRQHTTSTDINPVDLVKSSLDTFVTTTVTTVPPPARPPDAEQREPYQSPAVCCFGVVLPNIPLKSRLYCRAP